MDTEPMIELRPEPERPATMVASWPARLLGPLETAGLACQVVALSSGRRRYRRWSWAGLAISTAAAYLGGELVFGRGVMVDHDAWVAGPADWTPVLPDGDLPEGGMRPAQVE